MAFNNTEVAKQGINSEEVEVYNENTEVIDENVAIPLKAPPQNEWLHGVLDRKLAEERLKSAGKEGSYLIRESGRKLDSYVLSYLGKTGVNHFRIISICGDYYIGGRKFDSLSDLIGYYSSWSNLLKDENLRFPVPPPEPVEDKRRVIALMAYSKTPGTDELSFVKGEVFIVHGVLDNGWIWAKNQRTTESGLVFKDSVEVMGDCFDPHEGKEWFHSGITKQEAAEVLIKEGKVGSYLIRPSDQSPGDYSLYFRDADDVIQRFRIQRQAGSFTMGGRLYDKLQEIITHYKQEQIVEGQFLTTAIPSKGKHLRSNREVDCNQIYETIKTSPSGSYITTSENTEAVVKTGYLTKQSSKHKKWKKLYFVLNGLEQHLYFFENDKRAKPKGLIDLSYAYVYVVHDSFFNRPNCFQIVVRALSDTNVFYLNGDTPEEVQEWMSTLRPYCAHTQSQCQHQAFNKQLGVREIRSLTVHILDASKLSVKLLPHPYCQLQLNDVKVARTWTQENCSPSWGQEFTFEDLSEEVSTLVVQLYNQGGRRSKEPVCHLTLFLNQLANGVEEEEWHQLMGEMQTKSEMGSMRIRTKYLCEIVMPESSYHPLKDVLSLNDLDLIYDLEEACGKERGQLCAVILRLFIHMGKEIDLLDKLNTREIQAEGERSTLFRSNTAATTLMDKYMRLVALPFVHSAVRNVVLKIVESKQSCELNPARLEKGADVATHLEQLLNYLNDVVKSVFASINSCPKSLKYLCFRLQEEVNKKWPQDQDTNARVVSGFIFLRLICPAILNPVAFNIVQEQPSETALRTLTMVAKGIIALANLLEFGAKEEFMEALNPFIVLNKGSMVRFLDEFANESDKPVIGESIKLNTDMGRDLAALHDLCAFHITEIQRINQTNNKLNIKKLLLVIDMLTQKKKQYIDKKTQVY